MIGDVNAKVNREDIHIQAYIANMNRQKIPARS